MPINSHIFTEEIMMSEKNQFKAIIAYHANCIDGFTSAWITERALSKKGVKCTLLPMSYDALSYKNLEELIAATELAEIDSCKRISLYVVDFSLPVYFLERLQRDFSTRLKTTIIDHHKSAFEAYAPDLVAMTPDLDILCWFKCEVAGATIYLDNRHCGAVMCLYYFEGTHMKVPKLLQYVQDWDLWKFKFGDVTRAAQAVLKSSEPTLEVWDKYLELFECEGTSCKLVDEGLHIMDGTNRIIDYLVSTAEDGNLAGQPTKLVYCQSPKLVSELGNRLAKLTGTYGMVVTTERNSSRLKISLRSIGDFDVSEMAKELGGGGHKNAASYYVQQSLYTLTGEDY